MNLSKIHVAMCVDRGFTLPLAAALSSIDRASARDSVTVHVIHPGFSEESMKRVTSRLSHIQLSWHHVDDKTLRGVYYSDFLTAASLYRLLLGEILPPEVGRVLYLDADTITVSSLSTLYSMDLNGAVIGAVRDAGLPWASVARGKACRRLGALPTSPNLNSGMLLINLDLWRAESIGKKCLDLLRSEKLLWGDQDALNVVLQDRWLELPRRWNLQTADLSEYSLARAHWPEDVEDALRAPSIIHFTERDKPWAAGCRHPLTGKWFEALDRTDWSGWRPRKPWMRPVAQAIISVLRSLRDGRALWQTRLPE